MVRFIRKLESDSMPTIRQRRLADYIAKPQIGLRGSELIRNLYALQFDEGYTYKPLSIAQGVHLEEHPLTHTGQEGFSGEERRYELHISVYTLTVPWSKVHGPHATPPPLLLLPKEVFMTNFGRQFARNSRGGLCVMINIFLHSKHHV